MDDEEIEETGGPRFTLAEAIDAPHSWLRMPDQPRHVPAPHCWCEPELVLSKDSLVWTHRLVH